MLAVVVVAGMALACPLAMADDSTAAIAAAPAAAAADKPAAAPADKAPTTAPADKAAGAAEKPAAAPAGPAAPNVADLPACDCIFCQAKQKQNQILPWLKMEGDIRLREQYGPNLVYFNNEHNPAPDHDWHWQRYRERLGWTITPVKDLEFNFRLVWEPQTYESPASKPDPDYNEVTWDRLNVTYRNAFGLPVTAVVGRQDISLGDGWLVMDGTPLDGSRTMYFDAARVAVEMKDIQSRLDVIYIDQASREDRYIEPFNEMYKNLTESDERGVIAYFTNKSIARTELNGYYIYKQDRKVMTTGRDDDINVFGGRAVHDLDEHWTARGEIAPEFGQVDGEPLCALGANTRLTYKLNDKWKDEFHTGYEYRSGDNPNTDKVERFDCLWGRWPQWSEGYGVYGVITETGRPADVTNLHRFNVVGWSDKPCDNITLGFDYNVLFANHNPLAGHAGFSDDGDLKGHLLTGKLTYQFTKHISGHLWAEVFFPGNYFGPDRNSVEGFFRYELTVTW
jgi:hypothetical protein